MKPLSRRTMLRGAIGGSSVAVGLPLLEAMLGPTAKAADDELNKVIFGVFFWANGLPWHAAHELPEHPDFWTPSATGPDYPVSDLMVDLAEHPVSVVSGLEPHTNGGPVGTSDGHMRGFMCALTSDMVNPDGFDHPSHTLTSMRESIDQYVAKHDDFYGNDVPRFRSLTTGVSDARFHDYGHWNSISYNGPDSLNPAICDPQQLYNHLFEVPDDAFALERRASLMSAVYADAQRLRGKLGAADKQRLEEHMEHLEEVQRRLVLASAPCEAPTPPSPIEDLDVKTGIMGELLAVALSCNLTRVFTLMLTSPATTHVFANLGVENGMHSTCHAGLWQEIYDTTAYQMKCFSTFLTALAEKTDLEGNSILDRSVILGCSEYGEGWQHHVEEMPALFAGRGCGALAERVHVRDPGGNFAKAHVTALRAIGLDQDSYGFSGSETTDDFGEILV